MFILGFDVIVDSTGTGGRGFQCVIITEGSFKSPEGSAIKPTQAVMRNQKVCLGSGKWNIQKSIKWAGVLHQTRVVSRSMYIPRAKQKSFLIVRLNVQVMQK